MLKTISAALLAVSVVAAPVMAAGSSKTTQAPAAKAEQVKPKADAQVKPKALNANAKMGRHHVRHVRHHRAHKKVGAVKTHQSSRRRSSRRRPPSAADADPRAWLAPHF